jgi:hypothetical protein
MNDLVSDQVAADLDLLVDVVRELGADAARR